MCGGVGFGLTCFHRSIFDVLRNCCSGFLLVTDHSFLHVCSSLPILSRWTAVEWRARLGWVRNRFPQWEEEDRQAGLFVACV